MMRDEEEAVVIYPRAGRTAQEVKRWIEEQHPSLTEDRGDKPLVNAEVYIVPLHKRLHRRLREGKVL